MIRCNLIFLSHETSINTLSAQMESITTTSQFIIETQKCLKNILI